MPNLLETRTQMQDRRLGPESHPAAGRGENVLCDTKRACCYGLLHQFGLELGLRGTLLQQLLQRLYRSLHVRLQRGLCGMQVIFDHRRTGTDEAPARNGDCPHRAEAPASEEEVLALDLGGLRGYDTDGLCLAAAVDAQLDVVAGLHLLHFAVETVDPGVARLPVARIFVCDTQVKDRKSTRLNSSHLVISYAVFCLKKNNFPHRK